MEITIREYQSSDRPALLSLMNIFNQYIQSIDDQHRTEYKQGSTEYFTDKMIQLCQTKQGIIYVACDQDKIVGFVNGYMDQQDQDEQMEAIPAKPGFIGELFVDENYRGKKIGKQLLEKIEKYLQDRGSTIIRLAIFAPNTLALNFYERAGYAERLIYLMKEL